MRNVRRSPERSSSATTYHSPRSLNTRRGVIVRSVTSSRDGVQYSTRSTLDVAHGRRRRRAMRSSTAGGTRRGRRRRRRRRAPRRASRSPRPSGPAGSAPGSCIAARPAATRAKPSGAVSRNGRVNSRGTPTTTMSSSMNTSIISSTNGGSPHIAASSRSAATSPGDRSKRAATSSSGTSPRSINHGSITSRRRSRSSRRPPARHPSRGARQSAAASRRRRRARRAGRAPRRARGARAPTTGTPGRWRTAPRPRSTPSSRRAATRSAPSSRSTPPARAARRRARGRRRRCARRRRAASGRPGRRSRRSKPSGRSNAPASPARHVTRDAVDAVRPQLGSCSWSWPTTYQKPSRSSRPYGSSRRGLAAVVELDGRPRRRRLAQRPAAPASSGTIAVTATSRVVGVEAELPQRLPPLRRPHGGDGDLQGAHLVRVEVEVAELVAVRGRSSTRVDAGLVAAEHVGLDRHADLAQRRLVPLERGPPRRLLVGVLAVQLAGDLDERQRLAPSRAAAPAGW